MSTEPLGRIHFHGNPWPAGHAVIEFAWGARLVPGVGLVFDLHLRTAPYYAEDPPDLPDDDGDGGDWEARGVWGNYHRCTLSSTYWGHAGFAVGADDAPFDAARLLDHTFHVAPLAPGQTADDFDLDDMPINIYLLGHDSVADHHLRFTRAADGRYDLVWQGKIALTYAGDTDFAHTFEAHVPGLTLPRVPVPAGMTPEQARAELDRVARGFQLEGGF